MRLPPYPKYKPSGVKWLGEVPEHWKVKRLRHVLRRNDGGVWGDDEDPDGTVILRSTEQTVDGGWRIEEPARRALSVSEIHDCLLKVGDLVVTKSSGSALHIGKTSLVTEAVARLSPCFSNFMQRLRFTDSFEPRLAFYLLNSPTGRQQLVFNSNTTTGLANLNGSVLGDVLFGLPGGDEQRAIADFLDRETAKIDTLVLKKRTLIERLKEKRTALISRTVTRGLSPDGAHATSLNSQAKLKPSCIDWLGDVPEHWDVKRGRFVMDVNPRSERLRALRPEDEVSFVPMEAVGEYGGLNLEQTRAITDIGSGYTEFDDGDVVVAKITPCFENGKGALAVGLVNGAAFGTTELHVLRSASNLERRFLFYFTISRLFRSTGEGEMYGAGGQKRVPPEFCENVRLPLPPIDDQRAIANFLDRETAKIDGMVTKVETAIKRLEEYRTALITAAVTGKIDVRGAIA